MPGEFDDDVEGEQTISINEYLNEVEEKELEDNPTHTRDGFGCKEADLVLGGDEGKECTYSKGYMKRQAIFSCLTCAPEGNAGVCTACSLTCHDGHEIVELWTKRNFKCDCGNSKFGEFFCKLFPSKDVENAENSYNHNFKDLYCTCNRPYPDPEVEEQVEMIQCCICEDWFHEEHLGLESSDEIPRDEEGEPLYEDFICKVCSAVCSFLTAYPQTIWAKGLLRNDGSYTNKDKNVLEEIPMASGYGKLENVSCSNGSPEKDNAMANTNSESVTVEKGVFTGESSDKNAVSNQCIDDTGSHTACLLGDNLVADLTVSQSKPLFLSKNWRATLCRCKKCLSMYEQKHVFYLIDKEDSIADYERTAKQKREEKLQKQEGAELSFLNKLGHVEKMEILNGIADMKDEFRSFLESFDPSKAITSDDVHQIFENLAKKRRRGE